MSKWKPDETVSIQKRKGKKNFAVNAIVVKCIKVRNSGLWKHEKKCKLHRRKYENHRRKYNYGR